MPYTNSSLVNVTVKSPNHSGQRTHAIDRITPHCVVGQVTAERLGEIFKPTSKKASCNYGIDKDGRVLLCVDEANRSWCSSSSANDQRAVTIECASDTKDPYTMNDAVYQKLIELCTDICRRNGKTSLIWINDKTKALAYNQKSTEMVLTVHCWFKNKSCPGAWLMARMGDLASKVTANLQENTSSATTTNGSNTSSSEVKVQVLVSDLNIRKSPSTSSASVGHTGKGTFTLSEISDDGNWGKLKSGAGWIYIANSSYCTVISGSVTSTAATNTSKTVKVMVTATALNVRSGPGTSYSKVATVKKNDVYTITQKKNGWGKLKSGAGWISLEYVKEL